MTEINHRRKSKNKQSRLKVVSSTILKEPDVTYVYGGSYSGHDNGDGTITEFEVVSKDYLNNVRPKNKPWKDFDRSGKSIGVRSEIDGKYYGGLLGYETSNGHRGFAKAMRGIKQGIHRAFRQHEKQLLPKLVDNFLDEIK